MFLLIYSGFIVINKTRSGIFRKFYYLIFTNDRCMIVIQLYIDKISNCQKYFRNEILIFEKMHPVLTNKVFLRLTCIST